MEGRSLKGTDLLAKKQNKCCCQVEGHPEKQSPLYFVFICAGPRYWASAWHLAVTIPQSASQWGTDRQQRQPASYTPSHLRRQTQSKNMKGLKNMCREQACKCEWTGYRPSVQSAKATWVTLYFHKGLFCHLTLHLVSITQCSAVTDSVLQLGKPWATDQHVK